MYKKNIFFLILLSLIASVQAGIISSPIDVAANVIQNIKDKSENICYKNDDCNTSFFKIRNLCCRFQCCNVISFVFKDG